jgi:hypothetical protein
MRYVISLTFIFSHISSSMAIRDGVDHLDVHLMCALLLDFFTVYYLRHGNPQCDNPAMLATAHATPFGSW